MNNTADDRRFVEQKLSELRKKLLDLTGRNRLINYRHSKTGCLRIVDELPDQLHKELLDQHEMTFAPVPQPNEQELIEVGYLEYDENEQLVRTQELPDAKEWADLCGFKVSYELPPQDEGLEKHRDTVIQTLLYPEQLETRLKSLYSKAKLAIDETGTNILYLVVGFLEWYENYESDQPRQAPLYLIPVTLKKARLDRATRTYVYTLEYSTEDILPNISLAEKLRNDFGLALPELNDTTTPEDYFGDITKLIENADQDRWKVNRWGTLTLLNFSKLLMYLDLDPARWPKGEKNITQHKIVTKFFSGGNEADNGAGGYEEEYSIDEIPDVNEQFPLIDDADSSQHSALIDAIKGRDLVIEGPPGTGKSQTITNLIAAALGQGKSVLFVAEKMAALEVVKDRLDKANLGDFCLELHSHKMQKRKVLDDLKHRIVAVYPSVKNWTEEIEQHDTLKERLKNHAELINSSFGETGKTFHEILATATRYREELGIDPTSVHPENFNVEHFTLIQLRELETNVQMYGDVYAEVLKELGDVQDLTTHPWYGIRNERLQHFDARGICDLLSEWQKALTYLQNGAEIFSKYLSLNEDDVSSISEVKTITGDILSVTDLSGTEILSAIHRIDSASLNDLETHIGAYNKLTHLATELSGIFNPKYIYNAAATTVVSRSIGDILHTGLANNTTLAELYSYINTLQISLNLVGEIEDVLTQFRVSLPDSIGNIITSSVEGYSDLHRYCELIANIEIQLVNTRDPLFDNMALDEALPELKKFITELRPIREQIKVIYRLETTPTVTELEHIKSTLDEHTSVFRWFKSEFRNARASLIQHKADKKVSFSGLVSNLPTLIRYQRGRDRFESANDYLSLLEQYFDDLDTRVDDFLTLRFWYKSIRDEYGVSFGPKVVLGDSIINLPRHIIQGVISLKQQGILDKLARYNTQLASHVHTCIKVKGFESRKAVVDGEDNVLKKLLNLLEQAARVTADAVPTRSLSLEALAKHVTTLESLNKQEEQWEGSDLLARIYQGQVSLHLDLERDYRSDFICILDTTKLAKKILNIQNETICSRVQSFTQRGQYQDLQAQNEMLSEALEVCDTRITPFIERTDLRWTLWTTHCQDNFKELISRNDQALDNPNWMDHWIKFYRFRNVLEDSGFIRLAEQIETGQIALDHAHAACMLGVYDLLARNILMSHPTLSHFAGSQHEVFQREYRKNDHRLKVIQQQRIAAICSHNQIPPGVSSGRVAEYTELALIRRECEKKARHIPIRQLVKRSQRALLALKPCFMMGPMSVAQYLLPGNIEFDLVIMDEASQIKPEDALGAIARGKQIVIVGDPKQLPPTSFFDKIMDNETPEDELTVLEDSESVLEAVIPMFHLRQLRWHYRSRHESLIAFSNNHFYDGNLVLFPSPHSESDEYGIRFHHIKRGCFVNRRNTEEARAVTEAVVKHLKAGRDESVGVVAMNSGQRDQIEKTFEDLVKDDPMLQAAMDKNSETKEPLFFKNLENVQGDERDVIYISCTYGPLEIGGRVPQRFGPINFENGWRRLNVLFTRSKKRMHIYSSMLHGDLQLTATSKKGVIAFKNFLEYAQTKRLSFPTITGKAADSDFEISVANALYQHGYKCEYQVGAAGYYIDLAVRDPGNPGRFLIGIECDGATYHSAKSVRDRDRLRQEVLEGLGWKIMRIWSTDWFTNPEAQLNPILAELAERRSEPVEPVGYVEELLNETEREVLDFIDRSPEDNLNKLLARFDKEFISKEQPDVPAEKRLLNQAMIEALAHHRPMTKQEFTELIPEYLRTKIDGQQGKYIDQVLEIIESYEEETEY